MSRNGRAAMRAWALAAWASGLCGCAWIAHRSGAVRYPSPNTGATFTAVKRPFIFFHDQPQLAARARDYATVAAAYSNRGGRIRYVLLVYFWSTIDPRRETATAGPTTGLVLATRDRRIALEPVIMTVPPIDRPRVPHVTAAMYHTDLATLRYLRTAGHLSLVREYAQGRTRYRLWDDERASLADLIRSAQVFALSPPPRQ